MTAFLAGLAVAVAACLVALVVMLVRWWWRDRGRRRARDLARRARQDNHDRAVRRVRLRV